ncbi:MAG TPA: Gmad2 immunoglobulin-like domain-containing protein [Acidimicrobiia bacterium]|nr:Gmad2 immunoglobulin-like domain-containing protein [Acidimicrobiia bacterium]
MRSLARLALLLLLVACAPLPDGGDIASTRLPATTDAPLPPTSTIPIGPTQPPPGCPEDDGFVDGGRVMRVDQPTSDTNSVGLISWMAVDGCEQFTFRFETNEGAPATTPPTIVADFSESRQVLRLWTSAQSSVVTDQLVETPLVDRMFVVRGLAGGIYVDLHLESPAQARAEVSNSPAHLTVYLEPGIDPFDSTAVYGQTVVVTAPAVGAEAVAGIPVDVTGYARTMEANVLIGATVDGQLVAETTATAADSTETWGEFSAPIQLPPGQVSLFVGEPGPEEGDPIGVTIDLTVR